MKCIYFLVFTCLISGCVTAPKSDIRIDKLAKLKVGVSSKLEVEQVMGSAEKVEDLSDGDLRLLYGIIHNGNIAIPQIIIGVDSKTQKLSWITYGDFDQILNVNLVQSLYPNANFEEVKKDPKSFGHVIPSDKIFADKKIGLQYVWNPYWDIESLTWSNFSDEIVDANKSKK